MCWEDARVDRALLKLDSKSTVLMISSAGCNALSYLLDKPRLIQTVDINPRQTALLDLKIQIIKSGLKKSFYELFWDGKCEDHTKVYEIVRSQLLEESQQYWDQHFYYFDQKGSGLFLHGGSGSFARFLNKIIDRKGLREVINELSQEPDQLKRERLYKEISKDLWSGLEKVIWPSSAILSLAGIPNSQQHAVGDLNTFSKNIIYQVFVEQLARNNPYWGRYLGLSDLSPDSDDIHHPQNIELLIKENHRISFETSSFNDKLEQSNERYTHFVLLDHMDWMVSRDKNELTRLWSLLEMKSNSGTTILFRTAFSTLDFLPKQVFHSFTFERTNPDWLKKIDRVGTYTGTYIATRK